MTKPRLKKLLTATILSTLVSISNMANATIVQIQTFYGNIEVNLFDTATPKTVENFLSYINDNAYDNSIVHRSLSGFISQGGGYYFDGENTLAVIAEKPAVINEPVYSNLRGTIAMAKLGNNPNSATSQWFINLVDNSANLDSQNSGFTAFGQVTAAGMVVMDTIAALPTYNFGGALTNIPLQNNDTNSITIDNAVVIDTIAITDTAVDSAAALELILNTRVNNSGTATSSSSGSGSLGFLFIGLLAGLGFLRRHSSFI